MKKNELQAIAQVAAKNIKTEEDLNEFRSMLTQIQVEAQCVVAITFLCIIGR
jgi:putative transposase